MPNHETTLVSRAFAGDRQAFSALVQAHHATIYRLCRRYVGGEAEDLCQETFLRAFVERERFDASRPVIPWLITIARRLCIDRLRRKGPEPNSHEQTDGYAAPDAKSDEIAAARQELARVEKALADLADGPRQAFWLYEHDGLSYADIALALDVPAGTVMTWLHRARARLRAAAQVADRKALPAEVMP